MEDFKGVQSVRSGQAFLHPPDEDGDVEVESYILDECHAGIYLTVEDFVAYLRGLGYTVEKPETLYWLRRDSGAHLSTTAEGSFMGAPYSAWRRLSSASSYGGLGAKVNRDVESLPFPEAVRQIVAWAEVDGFLVPPIPADILELMEAT